MNQKNQNHHLGQTFLSVSLAFSFALSSLLAPLSASAVPPKLFDEPVSDAPVEPEAPRSGAADQAPNLLSPNSPADSQKGSSNAAPITTGETVEELKPESSTNVAEKQEEGTVEENKELLDETTEQEANPDTLQTAIFAGGCFWCMEPAFDNLEGVIEVISGYTGGTTPDPTYAEVIGKSTGHFEAVRITYDSSKVSYAELLKIYWENIDPTDSTGQFCDKGPQYLSAIFVSDDKERKIAEESLAEIQEKLKEKGRVATQILPRKKFYEAEEYHQKYYKRQAQRYKYYREACGRDKRLEDLWGQKF